MNLAQLADLVCRKIGKTDSDSVAACKDFLRQRHEMIYDSALWVESRDYLALPFPTTEDGYQPGDEPGNPEYVSRVILPSEIGRVISLRCGGDLLAPEQAYSAFARDPQAFEAIGSPVSFIEEGSSGISWPLPNNSSEVGDQLVFQAANASDAGTAITIRGYRNILLGGQIVPSSLVEDEVLALSSTATYSANRYTWIESLSKPATLGKVAISSTFLSFFHRYDEWGAAETERRHVVCRVIQRPKYDPAKPLMLHIYFKRKIQALAGDGDVPMVRGVDNALLAFAQADMLERGRQYSKAQLKAQEATALLQTAVDLQIGQGAALAQIQPESGIVSGTREDFAW